MNDATAADLLEDLVATPSVTGDEAHAAKWLTSRLSALGWRAHVDAAGNAIGHLGEHGPHVVLLGHIDTVPGHVRVRREGSLLYGRGSVDAKGPLVAFVAAATRAHARGELGCRVELVAAVGEEGDSRGALHRVHGPAPDACLVGEPSRWDGLTLGYKGCLRVQLTRREPIAHTAGAAPGVAALACRTFSALETQAAQFNANRDTLYDQLLLHLREVRTHGDGLHAEARLDIAARLPPDLPPAEARGWFRERSDGWELCAADGLAAWSDRRTSPLARRMARAVAAEGGRARFQRKTGTADLNVVAPVWGCPTLAYGPGDSALDHTPDEHIDLDELARSIAVLTRWLAAPL